MLRGCREELSVATVFRYEYNNYHSMCIDQWVDMHGIFSC